VNERYETVKRLSGKYTVYALCEALDVSRAGYYAWNTRKPGKREREDAAIRREILLSHAAAPTYGTDNIHADVREKIVCGRNRVRRLMKEMDIRSHRKRRYRAATNSRHALPLSPNRLPGLELTRPDQVWVGDITYIPTDEGWLYTAIVKDLFTREIVGHATGDRITGELAETALKRALARYRPFRPKGAFQPRELIFHSDRGIQYCSHSYQKLLLQNNIVSSMSRKGNPYDNATAENFFSCLKCEMVYLNVFATRREASLAVFRYIEGFYNKRRRHESLGRIPPCEYRRRWGLAQARVGAESATDTARGV